MIDIAIVRELCEANSAPIDALTWLPEMCDEIERLQTENARLRRALDAAGIVLGSEG